MHFPVCIPKIKHEYSYDSISNIRYAAMPVLLSWHRLNIIASDRSFWIDQTFNLIIENRTNVTWVLYGA